MRAAAKWRLATAERDGGEKLFIVGIVLHLIWWINVYFERVRAVWNSGLIIHDGFGEFYFTEFGWSVF